jgi:outer membrane immunogenic protein
MITRFLSAVGCSFGFLVLSGLQTHAIEVSSQDPVTIETNYANVSSTITAQLISQLPTPRRDLPVLPASDFKPLGLLSTSETSQAIGFLDQIAEVQVITGPKIVTGSGQRTTIRVGEAPTFHVVATIKPDGSTAMSIAPGAAPIVIPPGDTLLIGKTVPGQGPKRDNLYFVTPKYKFTPANVGSYRQPTEPYQIGQNISSMSWAGAYAGIQWGYTRSSSDFSTKLTGEFNHFPEVKDEVEFESRHGFDQDGFGLGGCVGYNYEFGNRWIFGVGLAGRKYWGLDGKRETGDFPVSEFGMFDVRQRFKTTYLVTAGPKLGRDFGNYFPYVTGGLAFGEVDPRQTILSTNFGPPQVGRVNEIQPGWYVGAGVQYRLPGNWSNWSLRAEYNYVDLGTIKYPSVSEGNHGFAVWNMTTLNEHGFNAGIVYNFGSLISSPGH